MCSLILYSGMVSVYLEDNDSISDTSWLNDTNDTLIAAADWLKLYNTFLKIYSRLLNLPSSNTANSFFSDLAQLLPVSGLPIYKCSEQKLFYPLFLRHS
ncbi:18607_t:CDS:2 [Funneliformis geosporum]|uniref:18607_t:CDS:1 n=1 Tax=Funneliformis geosporum TaxID=1117311 RepID=A0A9W4WWB7_9GLOM|nr:18607_t:CDS:2 [Funneliformis geosporum]